MHATGAESLSARLLQRLTTAIHQAGGWLPFDRFMAMALYEPGLGYYASGAPLFGRMPASGSDFVTAPEMSPLFGQALARQVAQALDAGGLDEVLEFGAGSGALAAQLLGALGERVRRYRIVDLSGTLRQRQAERLAAFGGRVQWLDTLPDTLQAVVLGNEVLDAMPVQLLHWDGATWFERGVAWHQGALAWADRPTSLRPPVRGDFVPGSTVEIHPQAEAFVRTLAERLTRGAAFFIDYGFPESEYYHPQRTGGTLRAAERRARLLPAVADRRLAHLAPGRQRGLLHRQPAQPLVAGGLRHGGHVAVGRDLHQRAGHGGRRRLRLPADRAGPCAGLPAIVAFVLLPLYYRRGLTRSTATWATASGPVSHRTGAGFFIVSRTLGATARLYLVVRVLQDMVLDRLGVPFWLSAAVILLMIVLYTVEGGVRTIVWTDTLQTAGMLAGLLVCTGFLLWLGLSRRRRWADAGQGLATRVRHRPATAAASGSSRCWPASSSRWP
jgi:SAM-dependent MidA family methyltransferase